MTAFGPSDTSKKIMVIEDNCLTLNQLQDYLYDNGYGVIPCKHSAEAKMLLNEVTPDLIILDIIMPDLDGYEFCKWIKSHGRLKQVPIIFLTARANIEDKIAGLKIGGDDYITKPFAMQELLARVEVIIQRMASFHELSMRDELTNAFNRRYFNERLEEEIHRVKRTGRPFTLALLDVDFFKRVNDNYGHSAGDYVLVQFVRFLQNRLRKTDLVARVGGEEFVLLLSDTNSGKAFLLVERLRKTLEETKFPTSEDDGAEYISVTVSVGIACCPEHAESAKTLIELADKAMYNVKRSGRNAVKITQGV